jgi:hypothetical protein
MGRSGWSRVKALWAAWTRLARGIGNFQARVLLTVIYILVLLPFGVCVRLFADTLRTKKRPTEWLYHPQQAIDMRWAHKQ